MIIPYKKFKEANDPDLPCRVMIKHDKNKFCITDPPLDDFDRSQLELLGGCENLSGSCFQLLPTKYIPEERGVKDSNSLRDVIMVTGPSQAGKTTFCLNFAKEYRRMYKDNNIILITPNVPSKSKIKDLDLIVYDLNNPDVVANNFYNNPITIPELADSLVIFDDLEGIAPKLEKNIRCNLLNQILMVGRHYRISVMSCRHVITAGRDTQTDHLETNYLVIFPMHELKKKLHYALEKYAGLSQEQMDYIFSQKGSRYCVIHKRAPHFVMGERYLTIL